jgi:hypothetical protein
LAYNLTLTGPDTDGKYTYTSNPGSNALDNSGVTVTVLEPEASPWIAPTIKRAAAE